MEVIFMIKSTDIKVRLDSVEQVREFVETMRKYIIERTNIDTKTLNKYKNKEWYLYAEDQIRYHIVDKIIDDIDEII